ncbi:MAG: histidine phosphatase family protein [Anaerolineae bacterium]
MTTRLYLIRHGATPASAEDRFSGSVDIDISDEGRRQAEALSERLADEPLAAIYCSPMRRTVETAEIIARPHGFLPSPNPALKEIDHGHWEGMLRSEVETKFGEEYAAWSEDPFTFAPGGGESGVSVLARALPVIRELVAAWPNGNVAVVSHKATIRLLISSLLGFDPRGYRDRLDMQPCCLNILDFKDPVRARLMLFNDVSHYVGEPTRSTNRLSKWWDTAATG